MPLSWINIILFIVRSPTFAVICVVTCGSGNPSARRGAKIKIARCGSRHQSFLSRCDWSPINPILNRRSPKLILEISPEELVSTSSSGKSHHRDSRAICKIRVACNDIIKGCLGFFCFLVPCG
ncbi:Uncharacterized protein TCM_040789 [Theobroma cacao]|uniref:Uncharacterized protein n=1 Tax=Theobroma cacao TaxID=3641 RepID=A0A061GTN5_THECC|nr:Uncharacterized protein TCM_040789 [Theobroma cacao]